PKVIGRIGATVGLEDGSCAHGLSLGGGVGKGGGSPLRVIYRMPRRLARSSTLFVSWVSSGTLPSGVIRSTTSGSSCERPRDASAWLMPARREISSIPSFPKICVIASGGIG